jgi:hypothetical protein
MVDPTNTLTASAIVLLTFQKFIESGAGELAKRFTEGAITEMDDLRKRIWYKMRGNLTAEAAIASVEQGSKAELDRLIAYLQVAMDDDPQFADEIRLMAQQIYAGTIQDNGSIRQNNFDNARGWQTKVSGGTAYIGEVHFHNLRDAKIDDFANQVSTKAEQVTEEIKDKSGTKVSRLLTSLFADDPQIRSQAALALGRIGDEKAVPALSHVLTTDQNPEVRRNAAEALGMIGSQEAEG